jgi:hypothetical protein
MTKIVNCNVPGDSTLSGYAGPVGGGRGSKRNFCKRVKLKLARFCALSLAILFTGLGFQTAAAKEPWFGTLGNGKFEWRDIVSAMALPFGIFTSCSSPTGSPPTTVTKTKDVTVSFPAFDLDTHPTTISLASTLILRQ